MPLHRFSSWSVFFVGTKIDDERGKKIYDVVIVYLDIFARYIICVEYYSVYTCDCHLAKPMN